MGFINARQSLLTLLILCATLLGLTSAKASTYTDQKCTTLQGPKPVRHVPSKTRTQTIQLKAQAKTTTTRTVTITPPPATSTSTIYDTTTFTETLDQETDTFRTTETFFETSVVTTESTVTSVTSTETTVVLEPGTTTVPTSAGFTPVFSVLPSQNGGQRRALSRRQPVAEGLSLKPAPEPQALEARGAPQKCALKYEHGRVKSYPQRYPVKVECVKKIKIVSTSTKTFTARTTKTQTADRSTETVDTTTVSTTTGTTTVQPPPTATAYAACSSNNILSQVDGQAVNRINFQDSMLSTRVAASALDCCNKCQAAGIQCGVSFFDGGSTCYFVKRIEEECGGNVEAARFQASELPYGFIISNSGCGTWRYVSSGW
ncbi:MAG: hypothetical protein M1831_005782 [Alyxoria varia]|nr:MAG: hypothetical protein M1831_005782 [Alyxoria varia]